MAVARAIVLASEPELVKRTSSIPDLEKRLMIFREQVSYKCFLLLNLDLRY